MSRSREVADARVRGVHFLMRKNAITEINGHGHFTGSHTLRIEKTDGALTINFDHAIVATGRAYDSSSERPSARTSSATNSRSSTRPCPHRS